MNKVALFMSILLAGCAGSQNPSPPAYQMVGGPCEGCEAILEFKEPLHPVDTLPDFYESGQQIKVTGTVYQPDGETPAKDVILYVYHTNQEGFYQAKQGATGWGKQHGYIRGWIQTNEQGQYTYYTLKPAPYPNRTEPAHIHYTVLEPNGKYYWLGSAHFAGDSLLTEKETNPEKPRGGSIGLLQLEQQGSLLVGHRDIVLGKNIPQYE